MQLYNNLDFYKNISNDLQKVKSVNKTILDSSLKKIKQNFLVKKDVFHSFSKNFKLNLKLKELRKYKKFKRIVVIGFGGSILGTEAIHNFLQKKSKKEMIFVNNLDFEMMHKVNNIKNLKNSLFIIISKSGNTVEVLSIINFLKSKSKFNQNNTIVITENKKSQLYIFAKKLKIKTVFHRRYIGGRYSIFSETAIIPSYLMGIDILKFKKNILNFLQKNKSILIKNLINLSKIYNSKKINSLVMLNYCPGLEHFLFWSQQLIAESLGKKGKGILPVISTAPKDHHSLLQLYLDGPKDKFFYIFSLKLGNRIKKTKGFFEQTLNNSNIFKVLDNQKDAMVSLLKNKKIPFISIEIKRKDEETLGELFSYFILETVLIAETLKVNPFNQPAVEQLKILTKKNLFKKNRK